MAVNLFITAAGHSVALHYAGFCYKCTWMKYIDVYVWFCPLKIKEKLFIATTPNKTIKITLYWDHIKNTGNICSTLSNTMEEITILNTILPCNSLNKSASFWWVGKGIWGIYNHCVIGSLWLAPLTPGENSQCWDIRVGPSRRPGESVVDVSHSSFFVLQTSGNKKMVVIKKSMIKNENVKYETEQTAVELKRNGSILFT